MYTIEAIEFELQQRVTGYPPTPWGRKQTNDWDKQTNFIYRIGRWEALRREISRLEKPLAGYAVNRWFNFWSARALEQIFCTLPGVAANLNRRDRLVDFSINGIKFDHKTSVFPQRYGRSLDFAQQNKKDLVEWLYQNQSREQRYHLANRLFVILYARNGEHWKLRAEISGLKQAIEAYVAGFNPAELVQIDNRSVADIIWFIKS